MQVTSAGDAIDLSGTHIGGFTNDDVTTVEVHSSSNVEEIPSMIFDTFSNLRELILESNRLQRIELTNCGQSMRELRINGNPIPVVQNGAFRGCRTVEILQLTSNGGQTRLEENVFDDLPNIREINSIVNNYQEIPENLFRHQTSLENLIFHNNLIAFVHPNAFQTTVRLSTVDLRFNSIASISAGTFTNMPSLTNLNLRWFRNVQFGAIGNVPNLRVLNMEDSGINVLDARLFSTVIPQLEIFGVNGNGVFAIDREFFNRIPALNTLFINGNNCLSPTFFFFQSVENDVLPFIQTCLQNFEDL